MTSELLQSLRQEIPFRWKVQTAKSWGCECVAYIDARQVMDLLDEVVGPENWQDHYREVAGKVYCDLSIRVHDEWVTKSDCGTASNFEAEKGQASDGFKRAAVKWGIGRFLYSIEPVRIKSIEAGKDNQGRPRYVPADEKGRRIYNLTPYLHTLNKRPPLQATPSQKEDIKRLCQELGWTSDQLKAYLARQQSSWKSLDQAQAARLLSELEDQHKSQAAPANSSKR